MTTYAVRLDGLEKPGVKDGARHLITRGNAYPPAIATYPTREAAQWMADNCPESYRARVVEWPTPLACGHPECVTGLPCKREAPEYWHR